VANLGRHTPPIHLTGLDLSFLVLCGIVSAALGLLRGGTIRIYPLNGQLVQRYAPLTAALWIGTIAVRLAMDLSAPSFGVDKSVASTSLLLMFGISLLGESLAVAARTAGSPTEVVR
jgi:cytochrome bd-type quinol oxidase subunit 2